MIILKLKFNIIKNECVLFIVYPDINSDGSFLHQIRRSRPKLL